MRSEEVALHGWEDAGRKQVLGYRQSGTLDVVDTVE